MIVTYEMMVKELKEYMNYLNPKTKIGRMVKNKEIIKLNKGYYENEEAKDPFYYADIFYGPSYISFRSALSYYELIPERVVKITCATYNKGKKKIYCNEIGEYTYRDVPMDAFEKGVREIEHEGYSYHIAIPEKAILDLLYTLEPVKNKKEMKELIIDNLRIDLDELNKMDKKIVNELCPYFHSTNVNMFTKIYCNEGFSYE